MHTFFCANLHTGSIALEEDEAHHLVHVLRLRPGDPVSVFNGAGVKGEGVVEQVTKKEVLLTVRECRTYDPPDPAFHIGIAPAKNADRMEWFVEKATEIGISSIIPFVSKHSERREIRLDRLNNVAISAAKQSGQAWLPVIREVMSFSKLIQQKTASQQWIAWCGKEEKVALKEAFAHQGSAIVLIGPEGDFTTDETQEAVKAGFRPLSLGGSRLRTETAALTSVAAFRVFHPLP